MGIFDYIRCDAELPETPLPPPRGARFQTDDTPDQAFVRYTITAGGALVRTAVGLEGDVTFTDYNDDLTFYTSGGRYGFWEYCAHFIGGRLEEITLVEFLMPDEELPDV